MQKVSENLYVGSDEDCEAVASDKNFVVVHSCKTCHQKSLGCPGQLDKKSPFYLVLDDGEANVYLNMIDASMEMEAKFGDPMFGAALSFIDKNVNDGKNVLIHCNKGQSRSPSVALAYLHSIGEISAETYEEAKEQFKEIYPAYDPGRGVEIYLKKNWNRIPELAL